MTTDAAPAPIAGHEHAFAAGESGWTLLLLHGTGGDEHDLMPLGRQLAPDASLLSPRGRVREGGVVNRFFARRAADDIDVDDMLRRTDDLVEFVRAAVDEYELDSGRIVALGYSNGANIALSTLLRHPGILHGAALLRPVLYHVPDPLPDLERAPVLAAVGGRDPYSPPEAVDALDRVLRSAGAAVDVEVDPAAGHGLTGSDISLASAWIRSVLGA